MGFSDIFVRAKVSKTRKSCTGRWLDSGSWVTLRAICWNEWGYLNSEELFRNLCWHITLHPQVNSKHTHAVSKTHQELRTTPSQLSSYPSQLPSCSVQCSHQDWTFYFVSQHVATLQRNAARKKLTGTQRESLPHAQSRDWLTVGLPAQGLAECSCSSLPAPSYRCGGADQFRRKFWIPVFLWAVSLPRCFAMERNTQLITLW